MWSTRWPAPGPALWASSMTKRAPLVGQGRYEGIDGSENVVADVGAGAAAAGAGAGAGARGWGGVGRVREPGAARRGPEPSRFDDDDVVLGAAVGEAGPRDVVRGGAAHPRGVT